MSGHAQPRVSDFPYPNFKAMLDSVAKRYAGNIAVRMRGESGSYRELTHAEFHEEIEALARGLSKIGLRRGDKIALLSENRIEWCSYYFAAVYSGLVIVPLDSSVDADGCAAVCAYSDVRGLVISEKQEEKLDAILKAAKIEFVIALDGTTEKNRGCLSFRQILAGGADRQIDLPMETEIAGTDPAAMIFTSGTTGVPKGVVLSQRGIIANAAASISALPIDETDNFVAVLPFHHTYPTTCSLISPIMVGGTVTIAERIIGAKIIANVKETHGTILIGVPLLFDKICDGMKNSFRNLPGFKKALVNGLLGVSGFLMRSLKWQAGKFLLKSVRTQAGLLSIRLLVAGGGPLSKPTADFFEALGFTIVQGYGMSENGPLISTNRIGRSNNASVGLPVEETEVRILEPGPDGVGEIAVRSPSLFLGYYKNREATAEMFTEDGFLKTGDLGKFDSAGFLYITGRIKNIIVTRGGKNIYPEEIESLFDGSKVVKAILVTGRKTAKADAGEEVIAVVNPNFDGIKLLYPGREITPQFIEEEVKREVQAVNRRLSHHQKIEEVVIRNEEFETTASGKIKRFLYRNYSKA